MVGRFLRGGESGAVAVLFVILLVPLLAAAGAAIDISQINAERRYVQAQADLAALSAARNMASAEAARAAARRTVAANAVIEANPLADSQIEFGTAADGVFTAAADQTTTAGATAVRVTVAAPVRLFVLKLFMSSAALGVERSAVAGVPAAPRVSFALSNCLLNVRLLEPILRPLLGVGVDVLCSGRGVDSQISLFPMLTDLAVSANLLSPSGDPLTYGDVLNADLPVADLLSMLTGVAVPPGAGGTVRLGDVLVVPLDLRGIEVGSPVQALHVQAADLVMATAEILATRIVNLDIGLDLGGIAGIHAAVRISEPRRIVMGATPGDPEAYAQTSQVRVEIDEIDILGIFTLALNLRVANATATLSDAGNTCTPDPAGTVAVFDPVDASLIDIDLRVHVLDLPAGYELLGIETDTFSSREHTTVSFTRSQYETAPVVELAPSADALRTQMRHLTSNLLDRIENDVANARDEFRCWELFTCLIGGLAYVVSMTLDLIVSSLIVTTVNVLNAVGADGTLTDAILSDLLGLDIARADLELLDVICGDGAPRLLY